MITLIGSDYPAYVIPAIDRAQKSIDVVSYDWRWYENKPQHATQQMNLAFLRAVRRGVRVRAVLNVGEQAKYLRTLGIKAKHLPDRRVLHAKLMIFDESNLVIGSHNLTSNAFYRNLECSVVIPLEHVNNRVSSFFENIYNR
jgi:phosphatidylserine/phosphatidylglycerophosphate/cardiolipin synthase-like enzyme